MDPDENRETTKSRKPHWFPELPQVLAFTSHWHDGTLSISKAPNLPSSRKGFGGMLLSFLNGQGCEIIVWRWHWNKNRMAKDDWWDDGYHEVVREDAQNIRDSFNHDFYFKTIARKLFSFKDKDTLPPLLLYYFLGKLQNWWCQRSTWASFLCRIQPIWKG